MHTAVKTFVVLALTSACAVAGEPKPGTAPAKPAAGAKPAAACKPSGSIVFEIDHLVDPEAKLPTQMIKVYANGAWTKENFDAEGKPAAGANGCYAKAETDKLTSTLAGAEWKVSTAQIHCNAMTPQYTIYRVNGKSVFIRKLCSGDSLDDKSMTKLQAAIAQVEGTVPAQE
jgi:hypothetical protein